MKSNTESSGLPDIFEQMSSAESGLSSRTIHMRGRNPKYMPVLDGALFRIQQVQKSGGTELDLSHLNLTELPAELFKLTNLTSLDISENHLISIPEQIGQLKNLTLLSAHDNPIEKIDDTISQLKELRTLLLHGCQFSKFPKGILGLSNLQILDLTSNAIKWIPVGLKDMAKLEEIQLTGNPILNLPAQFHETTSARLFNYYGDIASSADIKDPMLLSIYFAPSDEENKNTEGDQFGEFNPATKELLRNSSFMSKSISNPDGEYLFKRLYQYLPNVKILYVLTDQLNQIRSPGGEMQSILPEDFSELFACLPERELETKLLILDFQNAPSLVDKFVPANFNIILSRNSGTETNKETLPYLIKNLLEGHSLAFAFSEMWKGSTIEYRLSYSNSNNFDAIFNFSILGAIPKHDISLDEFYQLFLQHLLVILYPSIEASNQLVLQVGINDVQVSPKSGIMFYWSVVFDRLKRENKIEEFLEIFIQENPSTAKMLEPIVGRLAKESIITAQAPPRKSTDSKKFGPTIYSSLSNPSGDLKQLQQEFSDLVNFFNEPDIQRKTRFQFILNGTIQDITAHLTEHQKEIHLFHFSGHSGQSGLDFEEEGFDTEYVSEFFGALNSNKHLQCVLLNGCDNTEIVKRMHRVPLVIGTKSKIEDTVVRRFTLDFFKALIAGESTYENAFQSAILANNISDSYIPSGLATTVTNESTSTDSVYPYFIIINDKAIAQSKFPFKAKNIFRRLFGS